jgi:hypothetical protein
VDLKFEYSIIRVDRITGCIPLFLKLDIFNFYLHLELFQNSSRALLSRKFLNWRNPARLFGKRYLPESGTGCQPVPGLYNCFTIGYNRNEPCRFAWAGCCRWEKCPACFIGKSNYQDNSGLISRAHYHWPRLN